MPSNLQLSTGSLMGSIGGKVLQCLVNPTSAGSAPPAGEYSIQPPVQDVIYGQIAIMVPTGGGVGMQNMQPGANAMKAWSPGANAMKNWAPGANAMKYRAPGGVENKKVTPAGGVENKLFAPAGSVEALMAYSASSPQEGGSVFVLSSRLIPGRNCLVIQSGFADLLDALNQEGGATVRVF